MTRAVTGSAVSRLGGLAKTSLREQALDMLRRNTHNVRGVISEV